jgi:hypothetical protein
VSGRCSRRGGGSGCGRSSAYRRHRSTRASPSVMQARAKPAEPHPRGPFLRRPRLACAAVNGLADGPLLDIEVGIEIGIAHRDVVHLSA